MEKLPLGGDFFADFPVEVDNIDLSSGLTNSSYVKISQYVTTTINIKQVNTINAFTNEVDAKCCGDEGKPLSNDQANGLKSLANYISLDIS